MLTCSECLQTESNCICAEVDAFFKANGYLMEGVYKPQGMPSLPEKAMPDTQDLSKIKIRTNLTN